jgi:flagella basal body P-ring formation protein FlgA
MKITLSLLFTLLFFQNLSAAEIVFKEKAQAGGEWIQIEDVAVIKGTKEEKLLLKDIFFGKAPKEGAPRVLSKAYLKRRIKQFDFDGRPHFVSYPNKEIIVIKGDSKNRSAEVAQECELALMSFFKEFSRVDVTLEDENGLLDNLPKGLISLKMPSKQYLHRYSSEPSLYLEISVGEKKIKGYFKSQLRLYRREVVVKKTIRYGAEITEKNVVLKDCEVLKDNLPGLKEIKELLGTRLLKTVLKGRRVLEAHRQPRVLVKKGERIQLKKVTEHLTMTLLGQALKDGYKDQVLEFMTLTGRIVTAKVSGPSQAMLYDDSEDKDKKPGLKIKAAKIINIGGKK